MRGHGSRIVAAMCHRLAPHHHIAVIGDRIVVLDTLSDRYRLLGPRVSAALRDLESLSSDDPRMQRLEALGIIERGRPAGKLSALTTPVSSALEASVGVDARLSLVAVSAAIARAAWSLKSRGLDATLADASRRAATGRSCPDQVVPLAQAYARQRRRIPLNQICLPDSLALHRLVFERGLSTSLVIGVRLDPFGAHCWVQARDMVLNDSCDTVSGFTPILVL